MGKDILDASVETGTAVAGALVGFAIGGPVGAVVGAAIPPVGARASRVAARAHARRRQRAESVVEQSFQQAGVSPTDALNNLEADDTRADHFFTMLKTIMDTDPIMDNAMALILGESLLAEGDLERERLSILADSIRGLRPVHMRILRALSPGSLPATELARVVAVPEVELRATVRDLESRGMIKDTGARPVVWEIRELGQGIVNHQGRKETPNDRNKVFE